jgi:hypothetical protein
LTFGLGKIGKSATVGADQIGPCEMMIICLTIARDSRSHRRATVATRERCRDQKCLQRAGIGLFVAQHNSCRKHYFSTQCLLSQIGSFDQPEAVQETRLGDISFMVIIELPSSTEILPHHNF